MYKLLKKEFTLCMNFQLIMFTLLGLVMSWIPSYPHYVGPFYLTVGIGTLFTFNMVNHDIFYTATLPVKKNDVIKARIIFICTLEIFVTLFSTILSVIFFHFMGDENKAGINANTAYMGLQLFLYSVYNMVFIGPAYKKPEKPIVPFFLGMASYWIFYALCELPLWIFFSTRSSMLSQGMNIAQITTTISQMPWYSFSRIGAYLNGTDLSANIRQLPVLIAGIIFLLVSAFLSYRKGCKNFSKISI